MTGTDRGAGRRNRCAVRARRQVVGDEGCVGRCDRLRGIRNDHGGDDGDNGSQKDDSWS